MIERFHRTLKTAITASDDSTYWSEILPWILLGLRTSIKEDLKCSSAELVFGQTLRLPGELVVSNGYNNEVDNTNEILVKLRKYFSNVRSKVVHHNKGYSFVPKNLDTCEYVFVKVIHKSNLQSPYEGPFKIISKNSKVFKIQYGNMIKTVSKDLLKPANIISDTTQNSNSLTIPNTQKKITFNIN
ncbi:uncharacterized protein LOC118757307 [Rhagoletis pomonella]|uniref:uncharacterized protein LOC118757307 n=1 Tax=Rhagoletis pomonella TaxID=28610 RepID=UPI00177D9D64|nr:uncharacterized protein LOC118757307 [Rhagoletis pomonella]